MVNDRKVSPLVLILAVFALPVSVLTAVAAPAGPDSGGIDVSSGNAADGEKSYSQVCATCHGPRAEGNPELNAPRLVGQEPWYIARQLKNFKTGIRGADDRDIYGMQMRPMALTLQGDQAIADLVAYITSLDGSKP